MSHSLITFHSTVFGSVTMKIERRVAFVDWLNFTNNTSSLDVNFHDERPVEVIRLPGHVREVECFYRYVPSPPVQAVVGGALGLLRARRNSESLPQADDTVNLEWSDGVLPQAEDTDGVDLGGVGGYLSEGSVEAEEDVLWLMDV